MCKFSSAVSMRGCEVLSECITEQSVYVRLKKNLQ